MNEKTMTPYERGFLDCRERAAKVCDEYSDSRHDNMADICSEKILSLQPEGVDQRGAAATCTEGASSETGESQNRASDGKLEAQSAPNPDAGPNAAHPVAESQAPAPSEPGDRGVAPTPGVSRPASHPTEQPDGVVVQQSLLDDLHDFLAAREDTIDGADGPRPDRAMTLLRELEEIENAMLAATKEKHDET